MQQSILTPSPPSSSRRPPVRRATSTRGKAAARLAGGIDGAFYQHIVDGMRNGVLAITRDGTLALINDVACETLGLADAQRVLHLGDEGLRASELIVAIEQGEDAGEDGDRE